MADNELAQVFQGVSGCELIVLADVAAGTSLSAHNPLKLGQEHLDEVCQLASRIFRSAPEQSEARLINPLGQNLFFRLTPKSEEALCMSCSIEADMAQIADKARSVLGQNSP